MSVVKPFIVTSLPERHMPCTHNLRFITLKNVQSARRIYAEVLRVLYNNKRRDIYYVKELARRLVCTYSSNMYAQHLFGDYRGDLQFN